MNEFLSKIDFFKLTILWQKEPFAKDSNIENGKKWPVISENQSWLIALNKHENVFIKPHLLLFSESLWDKCQWFHGYLALFAHS